MNQLLQAPGKYIQGSGLMIDLAKYVNKYGNKALYIIANRDVDVMKQKIADSYEKLEHDRKENRTNENRINEVLTKEDVETTDRYAFEIFDGECCSEEINRICYLVKDIKAEVVVGIGSGKLHDTAKAVGFYAKLPVVIVPTIAASDAPCSSMSVINTKEGLFNHYLYLNQNPSLVFIDTDYIVMAPVRLLVAGMGDALSTYYEARACQRSGCILPNGSVSNDIAFHLSKLCLDSLFRYGYEAKIDLENKKNTKAVEKIVEANTYLSGVGFESGGLAAAHAINDGMSRIQGCNAKLHGEKVAFATIVQLVLENNYYCMNGELTVLQKEIDTVIDFCRSVGLPVTLDEFGLSPEDMNTLQLIADFSLLKEEPIHHMEFEITKEMLVKAILDADQRGKSSALFNDKTK